MEEQDCYFDDFRPSESSFLNETIGSIVERELTEAEKFKEDLDDQLLMADSPKDELTELIIGYIQAVGDANQVNLCSYKSKSGVAIDAWGFGGDGELSTIDLFLTVYVDPNDSKTLSSTEIEKYFNRLQRFYEQAKAGTILQKIDDNKSDLYQIAQLINATPQIDLIRFFILTNTLIPQGYEKNDIEIDSDTICEFYVWDAKRVMQQDHIISGREPIIVDFEGDYNCSLPCIKMPDVSENVICYLSIIPGMVLSQVYHKYHQQILEMNVRTFLQFKGTSNKGIRDTLIGHKATILEQNKGIHDKIAEPDMFFSYNNGISATASEIKLNEEGDAITRIKSLQIVNGGQTTAAISAVMNMKEIDVTKLAQVYVAMKISVIKDKDKISEIIPKISRYANTQSAVKKSDFNINESFLIELEQRSREEWVLNESGKPISKWFFERTRGQYLDKAKHQPGARAEKEFYAEFPKNQMFDKISLSKFSMAWDQNPASVCKGGENNYTQFYMRSKINGIRYDKTRYQRTIAKAILFKAIDAYYGKDGIQLPGYKSNMVAYTVALLSLNSNRSIDLDAIWREQCVISQSVYNEMTIDIYDVYAKLTAGAEHIAYKFKEAYTDSDGKRKNRYIPKEIPQEDLDKLRETTLYKILQYVKTVQPIVYNHIVNINEGENVNEWTKKSQCWEALKVKIGNLGPEYNISKDLCSNYGDLDLEVTEGQKKYINEAANIDAETWFSINAWSKENYGNLTPKEQAFMGQIGYYTKRGKSLTYKQAKWALSIYEKAKEAGWEESE